MPANIAAVNARGKRINTRSNQPVTPATIMSKAEKMNAPMASGMETPDNPVVNKAAPGVDQAVKIGMR